MSRLARLSALLLATVALAAAAPSAALAGWFPAEPIDGPSADVLALGGIDVARDGTGALVYLRRDDAVPHVFVSRLRDGAWSPGERVDLGLGAAATSAAVAVADGHRVAVAFVSGGKLYGSVLPGGDPSAPIPVPVLLHGDADPANPVTGIDVDMGINGTAYVVFTAPGPGGGDVRAARLQDTTWEPVAVPLDINADNPAGLGDGRARVAVSAEGNAVAVWGEASHVHARRLTGLALSLAPQVVAGPGNGAGPADAADIDIEDDGSFAWVVYRHVVSGASRCLARRLVGSQFEPEVALDAGATCAQPSIDMSGRGVGLAVAAGGGGVLGALLEQDVFAAGARIEPVGGTHPMVATSERDTSAAAWLRDGGLVGRYKPRERGFEPEAPITRAEAGPVAPGDHAMAGDRLGDVAVAVLQGVEGARQVAVAHWDRPPAAPFVQRSSRYHRRSRPLLRWRPGLDLWGPQRFRVLVDGREVGATTESSLQLRTPLRDGLHRWRVVATDRRGQQVSMASRTMRIDSSAPTADVRVTGRRRRGQRLVVSVGARDGRGSGVSRITVAFGDGTPAVPIARAVAHRYGRAGAYTLVVRVTDRAGNVTREATRLRIR